jgi:hypothetical protein
VLIWCLGCVCQSENDAVWGGFSTFALKPALSSPTFPKLQGGLHMNTSIQSDTAQRTDAGHSRHLNSPFEYSLRTSPALSFRALVLLTTPQRLHLSTQLYTTRRLLHHDHRQPTLLARRLPRKRGYASHRPIPLPRSKLGRSQSGGETEGGGRQGEGMRDTLPQCIHASEEQAKRGDQRRTALPGQCG